MLSGAQARERLEQITKDAQKPYGMTVETFLKGKHEANWDIEDEKELGNNCKYFYKISKWCTQPVSKITISARNNRPDQQDEIVLPPNGKKIILRAMEKNAYLLEVNAPKGFFNPGQRKRLKALLQTNQNEANRRQQRSDLKAQQKAEQIAQRNKTQNRTWLIVGAVSGLILSYAIGLTVLPIIGVSLLAAAAGYTLSIIRQAYLQKAASYYDKPQKVHARKDSEEAESLKAGVKAKSWPGYFNSYRLSATYTCPIAFAGGMKHAMDGNTEITKKIKAR